MKDPDARITMGQFLALWQIAVDATQNPAIGLHLRLNYGKNYMHFVIMIALNSENLLDALKSWADYDMLICDTDRVKFFIQEDHVVITYACSDPTYENRWIPEHHFSIAMDYARQMTLKDFSPIEVWFKHKNPGYPEEYKKTFHCPVFFGKEENMMIVKKEDMMLPIISSDPYLKTLLKKHADDIIEKYSKTQSLKGRVRLYISQKLHSGTVSIQSVSKAMNMDRSTLHRHLKKEGTAFRSLLTQTRKELAKKYLIQGFTASQTAYLLGFTDPSTFQHAFKRWYGQNPGEFQKEFNQQ